MATQPNPLGGLDWVSFGKSMGWLHTPSRKNSSNEWVGLGQFQQISGLVASENSSIVHVAKIVYIHRTIASKIQFKK